MNNVLIFVDDALTLVDNVLIFIDKALIFVDNVLIFVDNGATFLPKMIERWTFFAVANAFPSVDTFFALR